MAPSEPLLELRNVSVKYGQMRALSNVTYKVWPGQVICLLGGNASGKSTSMKAIFGVVPLAEGEVFWKGQAISTWPTQKRVRGGIAAVPEGRRVFEHLTIEENLQVGGYVSPDHHNEADLIDEMYGLFPRLGERSRQMAGTLSGGEQQMLAIARAMMSRPSLICMDEPSMGLAPALVKESFALIERLREKGTSIFVVEQNAAMALKIADYAYVLSSGRLTLEGPAGDVADDPGIRTAYLGNKSKESGLSPNPPDL